MRGRRSNLVCVPAAALLALGCAAAVQPAAAPTRSLAERIDSILSAPPLQRTSWGVLVREQDSGLVIYQRNPDFHFIPASNTKLVVTTVALGTLGPDWRYRTPLLARLLPGDTLAAELRIIGSGDPTLSARFWSHPHAAAAALATIIAGGGIRQIALLSVDASRFTDAAVNGTWEVGDLPGTSAPPIGAFALEEGVFRLELRGGATPGEPALATPLFTLGAPAIGAPQPLQATLVTDTLRAPLRLTHEYTVRRDTIFLSGRIGADRIDTLRLSLTDAPATAGRALAHALAAAGVRVDSVAVLRAGQPAGDTVGMHRIGMIESPPLADIVAAILQPSQNWIAEQLLKTLGAEAGAGGSWAAGLAVEKEYLTGRIGLDSLAFSLRDASGLSAQNLLTPAAIVALLEHNRSAAWGERYRTALAAPGSTGSTLATRLPSLRGRLQGKTGTIANVNSLAGYIVTDGGRQLTFSIMSNGSGLPAGLVRAAIDSTITLFAREVR